MKKLPFLVILSLFFSYSNTIFSQQFFTPKDTPAQNENCYGEVIKVIPETYEYQRVKPNIEPSPPRTIVVPAQYKEVISRVLIRPAYRTNDVSKMKFETIEVKELKRARETMMKVIPATYETVKEQVKIRPSYTETTRTLINLDNCLTEDGVPCFVWRERVIPATYKTVTKRVMKTPKEVKIVEVPAEYELIKTYKPLNADPNGRIEVPAEYKTFKRMVVQVPARTRDIATPPDWVVVTKKVMVEPSRKSVETVEIVCPKDYPTYMPKVKKALKEKGYTINKINAKFSLDAKKAILKFQDAQGAEFPMGQLDFRTLQALGIE